MKHRFGKGLIVFASVAILALVIFIILAIAIKGGSKDPDWGKNHVVYYHLDEAVNAFGDDLLLEGFPLEDRSSEIGEEYTLEFKAGSVEDRTGWVLLSCSVKYGSTTTSMGSDVYLLIAFDNEKKEFLNIGLDEIDMSTKIINDIVVEYGELKDGSSNYAQFDYNGNRYYFDGHDLDLILETIESMLEHAEE